MNIALLSRGLTGAALAAGALGAVAVVPGTASAANQGSPVYCPYVSPNDETVLSEPVMSHGKPVRDANGDDKYDTIGKLYVFQEPGGKWCAVTTSAGTKYYGTPKEMSVTLTAGPISLSDSGSSYRLYAGHLWAKSSACYTATATVQLPGHPVVFASMSGCRKD